MIDLDTWLPDPQVRGRYRCSAHATPGELWHAAEGVRVGDAPTLGRAVRWRIPGTTADMPFRELFRSYPRRRCGCGPCGPSSAGLSGWSAARCCAWLLVGRSRAGSCVARSGRPYQEAVSAWIPGQDARGHRVMLRFGALEALLELGQATLVLHGEL